MKKKVFSLMMTLVLGLFGLAQAQVSLPYTEGFENGIGSWTMSNCYSSTGVSTGYTAYEGSALFRFFYTSNYPQYLISPELTGGENGVEVSFFYARYSASYPETFQVGYSTTTNATSAFTWESEVTVTNVYDDQGWLEYTTTCPAGTKYVAVKCTSDDQFYLFLDAFTFTAVPGGGGEEVVVEIGDGTGTTYYFPIDNYFNYSCTEQIYTAEEIGTAGTINAVSFYYNYGTAYTASNVTMYMKHVSRSVFESTSDCEALALGDSIAPTAAGWYTFTLDTPFEYNGTDNLLVAFFDGTSGYPGTSYTWRQTTSPNSANMALRYYSDSTCPDPYNLASYTGSKQTYTYRANIQMNITTGGGSVVSEIIDFEDGVLPEGWTVEGPGTWTVGVGDYSTSTGTHSGDYNALCTHSSTGNMTYLVSPMFNFANALDGTINCWFVNRSWAGDIDFFGVYYRVNGGTWQELYYTTDAHSSWTEMGEIQLTGFANNYQIGFLMEDDYGYGVGLDDIEINVTMGEGPAYETIDVVEINDFVAPVWGQPITQEVTIPEDANYTLLASGWFSYPHGMFPGREMNPDPIYNLSDRDYVWGFNLVPNEGYAFSPAVQAYINGSADNVFLALIVTPDMAQEFPEFPAGSVMIYTYAYYTYEEGLHTLSTYGVGDNAYESIDRLLIERPNGAWMEPYHFQLYNDGTEDVEVVLIDFLHNNGYFSMAEGTEYPFTVAATGRPGVDLYINTNIDWTDTEEINSLLAVNTTERSTHLYQILAAPYQPYCPDVWEKAYNIGTIGAEREWSMWTSEMWNEVNPNEPYELHDNYTLPFSEIPEGYDAVMKFTLTHDMMLNAYVSDAECGGESPRDEFNGKVALYRADFNGEGGPMADNYYDGRPFHNDGGSTPIAYTSVDFETGNFSQFSNYTNDGTYPWYVAAEASHGGAYGMRSGNSGVASSTSTFTATVNYTADGTVSFDYNSRGEGSTYLYDVSRFYIDGVQQFSYGAVNAWNSFSANVTAGEHTFTWSYSKDSSVNNEGDCFYVDNIVFDGGRVMGQSDRELITIADGGSQAVAIPCNFIWKYNENQMILTADEIGMDGSITSVAYKRASEGGGSPVTRNLDIYMVHTSQDAYATTGDWIAVTAADLVFSGNYTFQTSGTDWQTITLDTPFEYNGSDNLCICINDKTGSTSDRIYWSTHTTPANRSMRAWGDANSFDPTQAGVPVGGSSLTGNWAADIQLNIDDQIVPIDPDQPVEHAYTAGPVIEGLNVLAGTYYLVASSTCEDFEVSINFEELPCPIEPVTGIYPEDNAYDIPKNNLTLRWTLNDYCNEYRLVFSSTYWPDDEPNHPATYIGEWTSDLAESFRITDVVTLYNNTNYFWRIDQRSNPGTPYECVTLGPVFGFTTHLNAPTNLQASQTRIFEYEDTVTLTWNPIQDRTYRRYRIYMDGEMVHQTPNNQVVTSWVVPQDLLTYNMYEDHGYIFNVTAVYDEGESAMSAPVEIWVSGTGTVSGTVYEQDETTPIGGVTVTITGTNEFGDEEEYTAITNPDGTYEIEVHAGNYTNAVATMDGYQDAITTHELPFDVVYDEETDHVDFIMDETFYAPAHVCAQTTYVQGVQGDSLVHVWWDFNFCEDFEAQIGNGTSTTGYFPFYTLYNYSVATTLYKAEELEAAGANTAPITSLSWYATNSITDNQVGITIWMANVTDTEVSTTSPLATGMTKVYTGTLNQPTPTGWVEFVFNQDEFAWDGTSNILILCQRNCGTWTSSIQWQAGSVGFNAMGYVYQDSAPYNVETSTYTLSRSTTRPNIKIKATCDRAEAMERSLHHFNIYRTDCYNDGPYNSDNTVFLASVWRPDTSYMDVHWPEAPVGVYKYGVSAVYAGNQPDNPNNPRIDYPFEERESEIVWHDMCGPCIDKDMYLDSLVTVNVVLNSADSPEGTVVTFVNNNPGEQFNHPMDPITLDQTGYYVFPHFRKGDYTVTIEHEGFFTLEVQESIWEPRDLRYVLIEIIYNVKNLYVSRTGWATWEPTGTISNPEDDPMLGRQLEGYKIMCTSIDGEPIFNHNTPVDQPFCQVATDQLVEGEHYIVNVAAIYSTGMSDYTSAEWQYESCENYAGTVNGLAVEGSTVSWDYPGGVTPGPGPGQASTFTVGFEGGLPEGWTTIDGNNDGNTWTATSAIPTTWTYYASLSLDWYHSGSDAMCSGSYINGIGAITPNDYLVSPQVTLAAGSQLSFWVAACDESYPADHFGVFVSTTGTNPSDFTSVQEWTLAAKAGGNHADAYVRNTVGRDSRATRLGTWYNYTVDLSAYAGQAYIAFRHFNCNDQYIMCLDDVELTAGAKSNRNPWDLMMTFNAPEAAHYGVAYDGENFYTSNWGYASAAHNFYKYDQQGNMLEGFEIAGCGTLRGMTTDGTYTYGVANANTVYCIDLAAHTLVGSFTTTYGAMRGITYDPVRDGFWVIGNWSGNLTLIDRTGAIVQVGPEPTSASDLAYYKDENDVEHVFCFNNGTNDVQDWVIGSTTINSSVFNFSSTPGFDSGTSGGCTVTSFNGKIAFIGDLQQSPNLIAVYELRDDDVEPTPTPSEEGVIGAMIFVDGEWEAFVEYPTNSYTYEGDGQEICVRLVYEGEAELPENNFNYTMSCEECIGGLEPVCEPGAPIYAEITADDQVRVYWSEPVPPIPGEGDTFEYDFENGSLDGLVLIDADGDGYNWLANTSFGGHNGSTGIIYSQSYDNNYGALTPDNYIVFPQSNIANGSTFSFWACGQDASWASEHFGVAVSTTGTNASDFTTVAEWTMTAKGTKAVRDGRDQGNWYHYTVDLSDYAGMPVYIAIRHFNSTDMFYLDVDDVELGIANKGNRDGIIGYNIYRSEDNVDYALIGSVPGTATEYFDNPGEGTFYYQVTAVYANCESEPAVSGENPEVNYVMVGRTGIGENSADVNLFPNPTKGNVTNTS